MSASKKSILQKLTLPTVLIVLIVGYVWSKDALDDRSEIKRQEEVFLVLPSPGTAKAIGIGFDSAVADYFWVQAVNYFGGELGNKKRTYRYLTAYCDLILNLDHYFESFYSWAATVFVYNGLGINRDNLVKSIAYNNKGIENLASVYRYSPDLLSKGAFNYALEARSYEASIPYFQTAARIFPQSRDLFLVASTYANYAHDSALSSELKNEYLGNLAFEATTKKQMMEALGILSSPTFNARASGFVQNLRLRMEKDDDIKKLVASRLKSNPFTFGGSDDKSNLKSDDLRRDRRMEKALSVDMSRTWLPVEMHVLFSL